MKPSKTVLPHSEDPPRPAELAVLQYARQHPDYGQARVAEELRQLGYSISASGVRYIWQQHGLETAFKRLKALEKEGAAHPGDFTPAQRSLLRRGEVSRKLASKVRQDSVGDASTDARRHQILAVAAQLFAERGYDGTSIRDLAKQVGLLPGSVYHHFRSKEELIVSVHQEGFRQLITDVEAAIAAATDPWLRLEKACGAHIRAVVVGNNISTVTGVSLFSLHDTKLRRRLQADRDRYESIFIRLIAALDVATEVDRSLLRFMLLGALNWTLVWYRPGKKNPDEIARQFVTILACRPPGLRPAS